MADVDPTASTSTERSQFWRYARTLAAPLLLWILVVIALREPLQTWLHGEESYDQAALQEWLEEARGFRQTLPEMVEDYLARAALYRVAGQTGADGRRGSRTTGDSTATGGQGCNCQER